MYSVECGHIVVLVGVSQESEYVGASEATKEALKLGMLKRCSIVYVVFIVCRMYACRILYKVRPRLCVPWIGTPEHGLEHVLLGIYV